MKKSTSYSWRSIASGFAAIVFWLYGMTCTVFANERVKEIISTHQPTWMKIRALESNVLRINRFRWRSGDSKQVGESSYKLQPFGRVSIRDEDRGQGVIKIATGKNAQYAFTVIQKGNSGGWVLEELKLQPDDSKQVKPDQQFGDPFRVQTHLLQTPLEEFLLDTSIVVDRVDESNESNEVKIQFKNTSPKKQPEAYTFDSGVITLDSAQCGCVSRLELIRKADQGTWIRKYEVSYDEAASQESGLPISKSFSYQLIMQLDNAEEIVDIDQKSEYETKFPTPPIPLSDFTLTAFGLPEPPGTTVLHSPFPYWLLAAIGGFLFIGMGFYFRRRIRA